MKQVGKLFALLGGLTQAVPVEMGSPEHMEKGYFDSTLEQIRPDSRKADVMSVFEQRRQWKEQQSSVNHPMLNQVDGDAPAEEKYSDIPMMMLWDFNHVLKIKLHNETKDLELIPTTGTSDLILMNNNCQHCFSIYGAKWAADKPNHSEFIHKKKLEYFYMMHLYDAEVEGYYYKVDTCLRGFGNKDACAHELIVYGVEDANPWFYNLGSGYFGLGPAHGYANKVENSLFAQMHRKGMIEKQLFGVHTRNVNDTENFSQIRFGSVNEDLLKQGHDLIWMKTKSKTSWEVKFDSAGFHVDDIWNNTHALIDPGYPFIGLPRPAFDTFKQDLMDAYPDEAVTCSDDEWCYFLTHCDKLRDRMPPLKFTFPVENIKDKDSITFEVPASSFLFEDKDLKTDLETCHVGVVRQQFSDLDHFVLGSAFMENFYVVYDATVAGDVNAIALSYMVDGAPKAETAGSGLIFAFAIMIAVGLLILMGIVMTCLCVKRRQQQKLDKAKAYFNSLKTEQEEDPDMQLSVEDSAEADAAESLNPNGFLKRSTVETENEQAVAGLL